MHVATSRCAVSATKQLVSYVIRRRSLHPSRTSKDTNHLLQPRQARISPSAYPPNSADRSADGAFTSATPPFSGVADRSDPPVPTSMPLRVSPGTGLLRCQAPRRSNSGGADLVAGNLRLSPGREERVGKGGKRWGGEEMGWAVERMSDSTRGDVAVGFEKVRYGDGHEGRNLSEHGRARQMEKGTRRRSDRGGRELAGRGRKGEVRGGSWGAQARPKNNDRSGDKTSPEICKVQRVCMRLLREAGRERDWERAGQVLEDALARPDSDSVVDLIMYNVAINVFAKCAKWEKALEVLARMKNAKGGVRPDVFTYNAAIDACGNGGQWEKALGLLREMQAGDDRDGKCQGVAPDVTNFNTAMKACVSARQWEQVLTLLKEVEAKDDLVPTVVTYTTAIAAYGGCGRWQEALGLLKEMSTNKGARPNVVTYSTAMQACLDAGQWEAVWSLLEDMHENTVAPNVGCYNIAITACAAAGGDRWEDALRMLRQMNSAGVRPNAVSHRESMKACGDAGQWEAALTLLDEVRRTAVTTAKTGAIYHCAMEACRDGGRPDKVRKLYREIQAEEVINPQVGIYNMAVAAFESGSQWLEVLHVLEDMNARKAVPDGVTYSAGVRACAMTGRWEQGLALFEEMQEANFEPDADVYRAVIKACQDAGQSEKANDLLAEMQAATKLVL